MEAAELLENSIAWLKEHYGEFRFFAERDVVWMLQLQLLKEIEHQHLPYRVFNDHGLFPRIRTDLAILHTDDSVEAAVEVKYEPSHDRNANRGGDIWQSKLPVASWTEIKKDMQRVHNFVKHGKAKAAYSILIDEGGYFSRHTAPPGSEWLNWGEGRRVLWARVT
jgi:hypothetical protein